jgi:hypothetical protein
MGESRTDGLLLKKTLLANDDAFLEFFTEKFGKVSVSVKKFGNSKKRKAEIDFFRILELSIFEGRSTKSLKSANTTKVFHAFEGNFEINKIGFSWLEMLGKVLPPEKPTPILFQTISTLCAHITKEEAEVFDLFFRVVILDFLGLLTRFDLVQGDVFFDPQNFEFSKTQTLNAVALSNSARQVIEFLRRSDCTTFLEKKDKLPVDVFDEVRHTLFSIEEFHLFE